MLTVSVIVRAHRRGGRSARPAGRAVVPAPAPGPAGPLPTPEKAAAHPWSELERNFVQERRVGQAVGSPATAAAALDDLLAATRPDELMVTAQVYSRDDRLRSLELTRELFGDLPAAWVPHSSQPPGR